MAGLFEELQRRKPEIEAIAAKYGISNIRVFGSVARGEERPDSDVDFFVNIEEKRDYFDVGGFIYYMEQLFGRRVDVILESERLYPKVKSHMEKDLRAI